MWLVIAVPADQGVIAAVFKQKFQCRGFDVAVAEEDVDSISMWEKQTLPIIISLAAHKDEIMAFTDGHHIAGHRHFRFDDWGQHVGNHVTVSIQAEIVWEVSHRQNAKGIIAIRKASIREIGRPLR